MSCINESAEYKIKIEQRDIIEIRQNLSDYQLLVLLDILPKSVENIIVIDKYCCYFDLDEKTYIFIYNPPHGMAMSYVGNE